MDNLFFLEFSFLSKAYVWTEVVPNPQSCLELVFPWSLHWYCSLLLRQALIRIILYENLIHFFPSSMKLFLSKHKQALPLLSLPQLYIYIYHSSILAWRTQGQGSLVGCHLWGCTESDTTEATAAATIFRPEQYLSSFFDTYLYLKQKFHKIILTLATWDL